MHVIANRRQITIAAVVDQQRFITPAKKMARKLVPAIKSSGVSSQEPFHASGQVGFRRLDHQMKMISHQTIGMDLPARFGAGFGQGRDELETNFWRSVASKKIISRRFPRLITW